MVAVQSLPAMQKNEEKLRKHGSQLRNGFVYWNADGGPAFEALDRLRTSFY
jgi:hypothetical protein